MACTGRKWVDFCSFDPRIDNDLQVFIVRVERDDEYIENMEKEVKIFLDEVDEMYNKLLAKKGVK
jgi:hypothetical protein